MAERRIMRWQDSANLLLGIWLFVSPWVLGFRSEIPDESWNFFVAGALTAVCAAVGLGLRSFWEEWVNLALGIWLILSPWILFFDRNSVATGVATVIGACITVLAIWTIGLRLSGADTAVPPRVRAH